MSQTNQQLTKQPTLFQISWPIFVELALHMGTGIIATLMLAHYSDAAAAAVGVSNQLLNIFIIIFSVTSVGATILISQAIGAKRYDQAHDLARSAISLNLWSGASMAVILFFFGELFLSFFNLSAELQQYALIFLRIVGLSLFFEALIIALSAILRSYGMTKQAMLATLLIDVITAIGAILSVSGWFGLPITGVVGVAWTIVIARFAAMLLLLVFVARKLNLHITVKDTLRPKLQNIRSVLEIGIPSAGENLSYQLSQIVITGFIATMGDASLAARIYIMNLTMIVLLFTIAIAQGTQLLLARDVGAREVKRAHGRALRTLRIAVLVSLASSLGLAVFGETLLGLFTDDAAIIAIGIPVLWAGLILESGRTVNIVLMGSLKSVGDVRFPVAIGIASMWGIAVTMSYLFGIQFGLGILGVWIAFSLDEWLRGVFAFRRWNNGKWQEKGPAFEKSA